MVKRDKNEQKSPLDGLASGSSGSSSSSSSSSSSGSSGSSTFLWDRSPPRHLGTYQEFEEEREAEKKEKETPREQALALLTLKEKDVLRHYLLEKLRTNKEHNELFRSQAYQDVLDDKDSFFEKVCVYFQRHDARLETALRRLLPKGQKDPPSQCACGNTKFPHTGVRFSRCAMCGRP